MYVSYFTAYYSLLLNTKWFVRKITIIFESAHDKTYHKTYVTSEDSDHSRSLIRVFANRMRLLQPLGYPKRGKREPLPYWVDVQADLSLLVTQVLL